MVKKEEMRSRLDKYRHSWTPSLTLLLFKVTFIRRAAAFLI